MRTFLPNKMCENGVRITHRSIISLFYNHVSFIASESVSKSKQQQRTTDAFRFNIK